MRQLENSAIRNDIYCLLLGCCKRNDMQLGRQVLSLMIQNGLDSIGVLTDHLIRLFAYNGSVIEANNAFNRVINPSVYTWSAIISANADLGQELAAFNLYYEMKLSGTQSDQYIYLNVIKACTMALTLPHGRLIHQWIARNILPGVVIGTALTDMYGKCGSLEEAFRIFAAMPNRNVVSWGAMITAYSQHGKGNLALECFRQMQEVFIIKSNEVIFSSILKSCASIGELEYGRIIHESTMGSGFQADVVVANSLIDMYAKCGNLLNAFYVFDKMLSRDVVSWNTMITGCAQHDESNLALEFFDEMQSEGVKPETATFCIILKACGNIGAIEQGKFIHGLIINKEGQFEVTVASALIDMYARCGNLERAKQAFNQFPVQDVRLWNAMIAAYAQHGETLVAQKYFQAMQMNAIRPNDMSFTNILIACSRTGLVDAGLWYFKFIREHHGVAATDIHFTSVTDILGRAGYLSEAEDLLMASIEPNVIAWKSLLNACKLHGNVEIGRHCFDQLVCLDHECDAGYVLMSNVYADCEDA